MKLETKFFKAFFFPFLIGVILSIAAVSIFLFRYSYKYIDPTTAQNIIELEKQLATVNINSVNVLITNSLLQAQIALQEQVSLFKNIMNNYLQDNSICSNDKNIEECTKIEGFTIPGINLTEQNDLTEDTLNIEFYSYWYINNEIGKKGLNELTHEQYFQILAYSNLIQSIYAVYSAMNGMIKNIYMFFEGTEVITMFPYTHFNASGLTNNLNNMENPKWCTDGQGKVKTYYYYKCREFYLQLMNAVNESRFDLNYENHKERSVFIIPPYYNEIGQYVVYTMCIKFIDPKTNQIAYICADMNVENLFFSLNTFNEKLRGYFMITSVNFEYTFYFPQISLTGYQLPLNEYIFRWDKEFYLEEKKEFIENIMVKMTSNYNNSLNLAEIGTDPINIFNEIYIDDNSGKDQFFYFNGVKFRYSIYPIILENSEKRYEYIMSIIYVYNTQLFYEHLYSYQTNNDIKLVLELILFIFFGIVLLFIVVLSFKALAKFIVIPIKNVQYMLKGINIGGENRLEYLNTLRHNQEENMENYDMLKKYKKKKKIVNNDGNDELGDNHENDDFNIDNNSLRELDVDVDQLNRKFNKKFDREGDIIEKELNFYDFDEELLQYRPVEINRLVKVLLDLKGALILTSTDNSGEKIIDYSNSENIFNNFSNKEGTSICQSNIGNLQSQLKNYDKAIYHLSLSLQDKVLEEYFKRNLVDDDNVLDEFDSSNTLLRKIRAYYNRNGKNMNEKSQNKDTINAITGNEGEGTNKGGISQKFIGILIDSRYNKLINIYYKFFSLLQQEEHKKSYLDGLFIHTDYHTIDYYHKILIQYNLLCFTGNDLIKKGECILDYIEFLIKFKLKTPKEEEYKLNIYNKESYKNDQDIKHRAFSKVTEWFSLFDDYTRHVLENTALGNDKGVLENFAQNICDEAGAGSQSNFLFKVNLQRADYLRGKFSMICHSYTDALFFFIRAAKKKTIVMDGLIKKKALKHIISIAQKIDKKIEKYGLKNIIINKAFSSLEKTQKKSIGGVRSFIKGDINSIKEEDDFKEEKNMTFGEAMKVITAEIFNDINEWNAKQSKDIVIIIDKTNISNKSILDAFIEQAKTILNSYLVNEDRLSIFVLDTQCRIICPMIKKQFIDIPNLNNDLNNFCGNTFKEEEKKIDLMDKQQYGPDLIDNNSEKIIENIKEGADLESGSSQNDLEYENDDYMAQQMTKEDIIKSINYCMNYIELKEDGTNEKFLIFLTNALNSANHAENEELLEGLGHVTKNKTINFLVVGKTGFGDRLVDSLLEGFAPKSEFVDFDNMKRIKTILSANNVVSEDVLFPNEIYNK